MRLTNITRALEVPTVSNVRTEDFYSLPREKSYLATREYSCGLRIQPFLPAPRRLDRFASVPSGEERAGKLSYLGERSKPCENARASEAARGQRDPFSAPPRFHVSSRMPLARPLLMISPKWRACSKDTRSEEKPSVFFS